MTRKEANKKLKEIMNSIKIGSKVLYRQHMGLEKLQEGIITGIEICKSYDDSCKRYNCKGRIGINNREPSCIIYDSLPNLTLIKLVLDDFIKEEEFMV